MRHPTSRLDSNHVKPDNKQAQFLGAYLPVHARLERYVRSMTRETEDVRDTISDTVREAYERFDEVRDKRAFLSFIFTIARRKLSRMRWRRRLFQPADESLLRQQQGSEEGPDAAAELRLLDDALLRLPHKLREALVLHELSDLPLERVAEIQQASLSAVKQRVRRARLRLRKLLGVVDDGTESMDGATRSERISTLIVTEECNE